jgi:hypothetical protein
MSTRKWRDARDDKMPWRVTVRRGDFIDLHRFRTEAEADAFIG